MGRSPCRPLAAFLTRWWGPTRSPRSRPMRSPMLTRSADRCAHSALNSGQNLTHGSHIDGPESTLSGRRRSGRGPLLHLISAPRKPLIPLGSIRGAKILQTVRKLRDALRGAQISRPTTAQSGENRENRFSARPYGATHRVFARSDTFFKTLGLRSMRIS